MTMFTYIITRRKVPPTPGVIEVWSWSRCNLYRRQQWRWRGVAVQPASWWTVHIYSSWILVFCTCPKTFFFFYLFSFNLFRKKDSTSTREIQRIIASFLKMPTPLDRALNSKVLPTCPSTLLWNISNAGLDRIYSLVDNFKLRYLSTFLTTIFLYRICRNGHCGGSLYHLGQRCSSRTSRSHRRWE